MENPTRRNVLGLISVATLAGITNSPALFAKEKRLYVSSRNNGEGHEAVIFNADGSVLNAFPLASRGHGGAFSPVNQYAVIFARRPGNFALVLDRKRGKMIQTIKTPPNRHFYGHGCFSLDGSFLYASENDFENSRGVISVWDCRNGFHRLGEYASNGIGPHEIVMMHDGQTLAVANGGIATHPDTGRTKLNIFDMKPNLTLLRAKDGQVQQQFALPDSLSKLSIRHLATSNDKKIVAGLQYQGPGTDNVPLVLKVSKGELELLQTPHNLERKMSNYCGSVAMDLSNKFFATTHPHGSLIVIWSTTKTQPLRTVKLTDGCGVSAGSNPGEFILSGGDGSLVRFNAINHETQILSRNSTIRWDNHMFSDCS